MTVELAALIALILVGIYNVRVIFPPAHGSPSRSPRLTTPRRSS